MTEVCEFLAELENHWALLGPAVRRSRKIVHQDGYPGSQLVIRPPFIPYRRQITTRVEWVDQPNSMAGVAWTQQTRALVRWDFSEISADRTLVRLGVLVAPVGLRDRFLVAAGGWWWNAQYRSALMRLADSLGMRDSAKPQRIEKLDWAFSAVGHVRPAPAG